MLTESPGKVSEFGSSQGKLDQKIFLKILVLVSIHRRATFYVDNLTSRCYCFPIAITGPEQKCHEKWHVPLLHLKYSEN